MDRACCGVLRMVLLRPAGAVFSRWVNHGLRYAPPRGYSPWPLRGLENHGFQLGRSVRAGFRLVRRKAGRCVSSLHGLMVEEAGTGGPLRRTSGHAFLLFQGVGGNGAREQPACLSGSTFEYNEMGQSGAFLGREHEPMTSTGELTVVYESGTLRPEQPLDLPDHTRLLIAIRRVETSPEAEQEGRQLLTEIRRKGGIRLGSWHPTRDELHERD